MNLDSLLREQIRHHHRIALGGRLEQLHRLSALRLRQRASSRPHLRLGSNTAAHVALHGLTRDAELAGDPPAAPT